MSWRMSPCSPVLLGQYDMFSSKHNKTSNIVFIHWLSKSNRDINRWFSTLGTPKLFAGSFRITCTTQAAQHVISACQPYILHLGAVYDIDCDMKSESSPLIESKFKQASEMSEISTKRARKPKTKTGCITCKWEAPFIELCWWCHKSNSGAESEGSNAMRLNHSAWDVPAQVGSVMGTEAKALQATWQKHALEAMICY